MSCSTAHWKKTYIDFLQLVTMTIFTLTFHRKWLSSGNRKQILWKKIDKWLIEWINPLTVIRAQAWNKRLPTEFQIKFNKERIALSLAISHQSAAHLFLFERSLLTMVIGRIYPLTFMGGGGWGNKKALTKEGGEASEDAKQGSARTIPLRVERS